MKERKARLAWHLLFLAAKLDKTGTLPLKEQEVVAI